MNLEAGRSMKNMYEYHLPNGLRLLLVPRPGLDVVTANITYHVGSRNEGLGLSGATHYLEHGMFKGSKKFKGKEGMWKLEELGAYMNATTYTDRTNYFEVIQTKNLKEAIIREGDRMLEPLLTADLLKSEMSVVRNEYERGENNSFEVLHKRILASAYMAHPYHHSTIGWKSDIENVSAKSLREFHDTFYIPNNATYTFVGNFNPHKVKDMVMESFQEIPRGKEPPTMYTAEPSQTGQRRVMVQRPSSTSLLGIAFKSVNGLHRDAVVLDVLTQLMVSGPNSPGEKLKKTGAVHDIMPSWERMKDPYVFSLWVTTNNPLEKTIQTAEDAMMKMLSEYPTPTQRELDLVKTSIANKWKGQMESTRGMASQVNEAISRGDPFDVYNRFDILKSVTTEDITRVAKATFVKDKSTIGWYMPGTVGSDAQAEKYDVGVYGKAPSVEAIPVPDTSYLKLQDMSDCAPTYAFTKYGSAKSYIRLSLQSNASKYNAFEQVSRDILTKMMTKGVCVKQREFNEQKIHAFLDEHGIKRKIQSVPYGIELVVSVPNTDKQIVNQMVSLLRSEIHSPALSEKDFKYLQQKMGAELAGAKNNVNTEASILMSQALFKDGGCNYQHTVQTLHDAVFDLTHDAIKEEHEKLLKHGVVKVSVLSPSDEVMSSCMKMTNDTFVPMDYHVQLTEPMKAAQIQKHIPGKSSCTVKWAHVIDKPNIASKLAIGVLGNGFAGRLMKQVRDKEGLTYGIYARQQRLYGSHVFTVSATFSPNNLKKGIESSEKVFEEWKKGITDEEIDIQKQIFTGSQVVNWDNPAAISANIHSVLLQDKSLDTIDQFKDKVNNVSYQEVRDALDFQLHIDRLKRVVVGTII
jgi:zinc protease